MESETCFLSPSLAMTTDTPTPSRSYSWIIPISIAMISLLGICLILWSAWSPGQKPQAVPTRTVTPFKYLFLATESLTPTPRPETATPTETPPASTTTSEADGTLTPPSTGEAGTFIIEDTPTVTITPDPIFAEAGTMTVGKYDSTDSEITRVGTWNNQNNADAYEGTLLVSNTVGSHVAFSFIGSYMVLGYQSTNAAGDMLVNIDGSEVTITQLVGNAWFSQELGPATHYVILTHESGPTVNLDYIEIPE